MKPDASQSYLIDGPDGRIELLADVPEQIRGIALVAHPHPLFG